MIISPEKLRFHKDPFSSFTYPITSLHKNFIESPSEILPCHNIKKLFEIICACILAAGNLDLPCELKVTFDIMCGVKLLKMRSFCHFLVAL